MPSATIVTRQHLTHADQTYVGSAYIPGAFDVNLRKGVPVDWITKFDLGSPVAVQATSLISSAATTEMPNAATKTYLMSQTTSPVDDANKPTVSSVVMSDGATYSVAVLDVPRNITSATTVAAADTVITITGFSVYKTKMVETITIASGASSGAGLKAFKYIYSIAITSAGDVTSDTLSVGFGDVLGLPYRLTAKSDILAIYFNNVLDTSATVVVGDATTATATTGDTRGTIDTTSASNGSPVAIWMRVADHSTSTGAFGVSQYAG